jgi:hypothetical protein
VLSNGFHVNGASTVAITSPGPGLSRLSLTNIDQFANGQYHCTVADTSADPDAVSAAATLTKRNTLTADVSPSPVTRRNYSEALTLTVTTTGGFTPLTYQWAVSTNGGSSWTDLVDGTITHNRPGVPGGTVAVDVTTTGAQGPVLVIDHPLFNVHGGIYRCTVKDSQHPIQGLPQGTQADSSTVTIANALAVVDGPGPMELYAGNITELEVTVIGGNPGNYTYTWDLFDPVSGLTLPILNSNLNPFIFTADAGPPVESVDGWMSDTGSPGMWSFLASDFAISGPNGGARLENLPVDVQPAVEVAITTPPAELTKNVTQTLTLTSSVSGGYPGYTHVWTYNGTVLLDGQPHPSGSTATVSGATTDTLVIGGLRVADAGDYAVQVIDSKGNAGNLVAPCPSHNGLCSDSAQVTVQVTNNLIVLNQPVGQSVYAGDTVSFEVTAGGGVQPYFFDWFWTSEDGIGPITIPFVGSHPASQTGSTVSVNSAGATSTLTVSNVGVGMPSPGIPRGDEGAYYVVVNDGVLINQPDTSEDAALGVFPPVAITTQPVAQVAYAGQAVTYSVQATGGINDSRAFQWQVNTGSGFGDIIGATSSTLELPAVVLADDGNLYQCIVTAPDSSVPTPLANYEKTSASAGLSVSSALAVQPVNPALVKVYVDEAPFELRALFDGGMPEPGPLELGYATDWRRTGMNPVIPETSAGPGSIVLPTPETPELTALLPVNPASLPVGVHDFRVDITDQVQTTSSLPATVEVAMRLSFSKPLEDANVREGDNFTWSIEVSGGFAPFEYQWDRLVDDGTKAQTWVPVGTNAPSLTFTDLSFEDSGLYQVTVNDALDSQLGPSTAQLIVQNALPAGGALGLALFAALSALGGALALRRRENQK